MPMDIKLERGIRGYNIVRKKCPNCDAELIFKIHKNAIHDVGGEGIILPRRKRCSL